MSFNKLLAEFREIASTIPVRKWQGPVKKHENLKALLLYWREGHNNGGRNYEKKHPEKSKYKKSGIPSKISFPRSEDPKLWGRQYAWFKIHPEATEYVPAKGRGIGVKNR